MLIFAGGNGELNSPYCSDSLDGELPEKDTSSIELVLLLMSAAVEREFCHELKFT